MIPISKDHKLVYGNCSEDVTSMVIGFDYMSGSPKNLTLSFNRTMTNTTTSVYNYNDVSVDYALTEVSFSYLGSDRYMQNHPGTVMLEKSKK